MALAISIGAVLLVLASAPLWAPRVGLGLPPPPPPGIRVTLASGHQINVVDEGTGPPVVLVHGLPGSAHDWRPFDELDHHNGHRTLPLPPARGTAPLEQTVGGR